ncbi:MAG: GreA/GreB family elongation factor [Crocinitomicaceae bacterium]|nr:GreA/GreB family elongation factor [Crocinitomicaceae bacterium]
MLSKEIVYQELSRVIEDRIIRIQTSISDSQNAMKRETKSTAGDKHETGRAMAQLEQEKLGKQLINNIQLREGLSRIDMTKHHTSIAFGSFIQTNMGYFFLSVGIGQIKVNNIEVFCMTASTPLGRTLLGKKISDTVELNGRKFEILDLK